MFKDEHLFYTKNQYNQIVVSGIADKTAKKIVVPENIDGEPVRIITRSAFEGCLNIKAIILPKTIIRIEENAFRDFTNLKKVVIQDGASLIIIENSAFEDCTELEIFQCSAVLVLGAYCFKKCKNLKSFETPLRGFIPYGTFQNCSELSKLIIFEQTTGFQSMAILGCSIQDIYFKTDIELDGPVLKLLKKTTIHCPEHSEFINLAFEGYKIVIEN